MTRPMTRTDRRTELARYRERMPMVGVYALRCTATGECWIGSSPTLDTVENRHRFALSQGSHPNTKLQAAARDHGPEAITFEVLEILPQGTPGIAVERVLRERLAQHQDRLGASRL